MSLETLKIQVVKKAWAEPEFKQSLLADPKKAIKEAFGVEIPADIELTTLEEKPNSYYLVIPPNPEELVDGTSSVKGVW